MANFNVPPSWRQHLPSSFRPAPDWQPDLSWGPPPAGWVLWVDETTGYPAPVPPEYSANPFLNITMVNDSPVQPLTSARADAPADGTKKMSKGAKIGIGVAAVVVFAAIVGSCGGGDTDQAAPAAATPSAAESIAAAPSTTPVSEPVIEETESSEPTASEEPTPEPEPEMKMPAAQQKFSETVADASAKYDETDNELKATKIIMDRDKSLCKSTGGTFKGWKATVHDVGSTGDGYGYIAVIMEDDIELSTWNNALSDTFDDTLIKPSNKLYDVLMELSSGDEVTIGGDFTKGEETCVNTSNLTEVLNASSPDFKVSFTSIKAD